MIERFDDIWLEDEQEQLLVALVEAWRNLPRDKRQKFVHVQTFGGSFIIGLDNYLNPYIGDIEALAYSGLLNTAVNQTGSLSFDITPAGFRYYDYLKRSIGQPVQRVEETVKAYLESDRFQSRYAKAYIKWAQAEEMLWSSDTEKQLTTIGHLCREAMQHFATVLVERFQPAEVTDDISKTVKRISAVMEQHSAQASETTTTLLKALLGYWAELNNSVQRQEHGAQKEGEPLKWEDARRVVFHTAVVMFEIDRVVNA